MRGWTRLSWAAIAAAVCAAGAAYGYEPLMHLLGGIDIIGGSETAVLTVIDINRWSTVVAVTTLGILVITAWIVTRGLTRHTIPSSIVLSLAGAVAGLLVLPLVVAVAIAVAYFVVFAVLVIAIGIAVVAISAALIAAILS